MQRNWKNGPKLSHCEAKEILKSSYFDNSNIWPNHKRNPKCFFYFPLWRVPKSCLSHLMREIANPLTSQIWKNNYEFTGLWTTFPKFNFLVFCNELHLIGPSSTVNFKKEKKKRRRKSLKLWSPIFGYTNMTPSIWIHV